MHRLASSFVLGYHGCDKAVADRLLSGVDFKPSQNDFDWLGSGIYFWEANPIRGLEFAEELKHLNRGPKIRKPAVVGAVIELGLCLDLTTSAGVQHVRSAHQRLVQIVDAAGYPLPSNSPDQMRRDLDCAVINLLHTIRDDADDAPIDTIRGVFLEGAPIFDGSGFFPKLTFKSAFATPNALKAYSEFLNTNCPNPIGRLS